VRCMVLNTCVGNTNLNPHRTGQKMECKPQRCRRPKRMSWNYISGTEENYIFLYGKKESESKIKVTKTQTIDKTGSVL
jgi:hypothetical protein